MHPKKKFFLVWHNVICHKMKTYKAFDVKLITAYWFMFVMMNFDTRTRKIASSTLRCNAKAWCIWENINHLKFLEDIEMLHIGTSGVDSMLSVCYKYDSSLNQFVMPPGMRQTPYLTQNISVLQYTITVIINNGSDKNITVSWGRV